MANVTVASPARSTSSDRDTAAVRRSARQVVRDTLWSLLRRVVMTPAGLRAVNLLHRRLSLSTKRRFFYLGCDETCVVEGPWAVDFAGRRLVLPLRREFRLGWVTALGFHGNDTEIHQLYEALLSGEEPPRVFFDVGTSYGLHSLKLLAHGARVISFEPNTACHFFLQACGERNGLSPEIHAVAVGARSGTVELAVPGDQTYLGTVTDSVKDRWQGRPDVTTRVVPLVTLDAFAAEHGLVPDLVKIDAEGSELAVLEGARHLLEHARPHVVVESWPTSRERAALFLLLASHGYRLRPLTFPARPCVPLTLAAFLDSPALNFLARPHRR